MVWKVDDKQWNKQYEKLVEFKRKNGHCLVPSKYEEDKVLGVWAVTQRHFHSKNTIRLDRKKLLDEIGFVWSVDYSARWNKQYEKLVAFKRKNGHCIVPKRYPQDLSLGKWVGVQRSNHAKHTIPQARKNLLNKLGFVWKVFDTVAARSSTTTDYVSCLSWMVPFSIYYSGPFFSHSCWFSAF
jgi:hypothetical protein